MSNHQRTKSHRVNMAAIKKRNAEAGINFGCGKLSAVCIPAATGEPTTHYEQRRQEFQRAVGLPLGD
jgi:hypothetical protein